MGQRTEMYAALSQDSDIKITQKPENRVDVSFFFAMTGLPSSSDVRKILQIIHLPDDRLNILTLSTIHLSIPSAKRFQLMELRDFIVQLPGDLYWTINSCNRQMLCCQRCFIYIV